MTDSLLLQCLKAGQPHAGGCVCLAGDCPNCLATVDGVSYVRTCRRPAQAGATVHFNRPGDLPAMAETAADESPAVATVFCDVVVIGQGPAGRAAAEEARTAGRHVETVDAEVGDEAIGIYPGPLVVVRGPAGMRHLRPRVEVVVATGAAEVQPVVPGADLRGVVTARAASTLYKAGLPLGRVAAVGQAPADVPHQHVAGTLVRFEASTTDATRVGAVVTVDAQGRETRTEAETVSVGLGLVPRNTLLRMAHGLPVRGVGDVLLPPATVTPPTTGTVCPCVGVLVEDVASVYERGFRDLELVKRATLSGTGPCQGTVCVPHIRAWLAQREGALQAPFTARPLTRAATIAEVAAGSWHTPTLRTPLDALHRAAGATMERMGGWWRPWHYGAPEAEYTAARQAAALCDVSSLGKFVVSGPGALSLLEHLYPLPLASMAPGRLRYVFLLDERGYVMDDGLVCRDEADRWYLTFTSGGATHAEAWLRDWADSIGADVRILNKTHLSAAIAISGPRAAHVLAQAGVQGLPAFGRHAWLTVAGVRCRVLRLSFTGEVSYELHHDAADAERVWAALSHAGATEGIRPMGLQTLLTLRLEKGHVIVGQDTEFDTTLRRLNATWALSLSKSAFVGRDAVVRTNALPLDRQLCGLQMEGAPPEEGAVIVQADGTIAGVVTSSAWSPTLGCAVMLGWLSCLADGTLPADVQINGRTARRVPVPFYDPEGHRARA